MRKAVAVFAVLAALAWTGVVWGAYVVLAGAGAFVAQNATAVGLPAETAELAAWAQLLFDSFGQGAAIVLWLIGIALIGVVWLIVRALGSRTQPRQMQYDVHSQPRGAELGPTPSSPPAAPPAWGRNVTRR